MVIEEFSLADKGKVGQGMNKPIGEEILGVMPGHIKILEDRIVEENIEVITEMKTMVNTVPEHNRLASVQMLDS